jgi:hypothetical protein
MKTTTTEKATARPWSKAKKRANAALIVKAVNEHDLLNAVAEAAEKTFLPRAAYVDMRRLQDAIEALKSFREGGK